MVLTVDGLTLDHIGIVAACEEAVPIAADNALDVAIPGSSAISITEPCLLSGTYPLCTLKKRPSILVRA